MNGHEQYEILCAVAVAGEISNEELQDLKAHLADCSDCRERVSDFAQVSAQALPLYGDSRRHSLVPSQMTSRFIERARAEGIPLRPPLMSLPSFSSFLKPRPVWVAAIAASLAVVLFVFTTREPRHSQAVQSSNRGALSIPAAPTVSPQAVSNTPGPSLDEERDSLSLELKNQKLKVEELQKQIASLEQDRTTFQEEKNKLLARLTAVDSEMTKLQQSFAQKGAEMADLQKQLDLKKLAETDGVATLAERQIQIENLRNQIAQRDEELGHDKALLAAGNQARDLIVARNLHIIDVHDSNGSGKHQPPFGRIFYTEGKSLVFYAYDLQDAGRLDAKVAFHVWGSKLEDQQQARNLGVLRTENAGEGRWVLTCEDPHVLAQVNTVFVTAESSRKNVDRPKGKRILYAFLGDRPNHP